MGGSSSSSSQATNQTDNRRTIAAGGISNEGGTVNVLDGGAIKNSFDFAGAVSAQSFDLQKTTLAKALDFSSKSQGQALDSLNVTSNLVKDAYADAKGRGAMTDQILIGSVAMAGLVTIAALRRK
jgi:hypothetical protein